MTNEDRLEFCRSWIARVKANNGVLTTERENALKYWRGDPSIVKFLDGRSEVTTNDCFASCERAKPALLKVFTSGNQIVSMKPVRQGAIDQDAIRDYETIVNTMMRRKNPWYMINNDIIDEALKMKMALVKISWETDTYTERKEYKSLSAAELAGVLDPAFHGVDELEEVSRSEVNVADGYTDPETGLEYPEVKAYDVTLKLINKDSYIKYTPVPAEDVGFLVETPELDKTPFLYHIVRYRSWEFAEKYGDDMLDECRNTVDEITNNINSERFSDLGGVDWFYDEGNDEWCVFECHYQDPDTGEWWITDVCGNEVLKSEANGYGFLPFEGWTPLKLSHRYIGFSLVDVLMDYEAQRTVLLRGMFDAVQQSLHRRYFADASRLNLDDYLNNNSTNALIRTEGPPGDVVVPEIKAPLPPELFNLWQALDTEKDYDSPTPRAYQGTNSTVLNDTFRGQAQQVSMASERINMMTRLYGEMFLVPLIKKSLQCLDRFCDDATAMRYIGRPLPKIKVRDLIYTVDAGLGSGDKQQMIMYCQQLLGLQSQLAQSGYGIVTPDDVYNTYSALLRAMELINVDDYSTDPKWSDAVKQLVQMVGQISSRAPQGAPPQLKQLVAQIAQGLGMDLRQVFPPQQQTPPQGPPPLPGNGGGPPLQPNQAMGNGGTFPGQLPPAGPLPPAQPMNPTMPSMGGYFG